MKISSACLIFFLVLFTITADFEVVRPSPDEPSDLKLCKVPLQCNPDRCDRQCKDLLGAYVQITGSCIEVDLCQCAYPC